MSTEADEADELEAALAEVPRGALVLAGAAVGLLMLAWFAIYLFVFLPRGQVG
jgi:asparagine N-glycosylation enzyme membrane subunit Stt3